MEKVEYRTDGLHPSYIGNPLIEALPPILDRKEWVSFLLRYPEINLQETLDLPPHLRMHDAPLITHLNIPFDTTVSLATRIDIEMRQSLNQKRPNEPDTQRWLDNVKKEMAKKIEKGMADTNSTTPSGRCISVLGPSGMGKTKTILSILERYPQVIEHTEYRGIQFRQKQLVWISVNAPVNGAIRALCESLLIQLDLALGSDPETSYRKQHGGKNIAGSILHIAQIISTHSLGILHIDDLQRSARTGKDLLEFVIQLANVARCPLLLSGTSAANEMLSKSLEAGRRSCNAGGFALNLPRTAKDKEFLRLLKVLFDYQLLPESIDWEAEKEKWGPYLFKLTMGIRGVMVTVFYEAMMVALEQNARKLEESHFEAGYERLATLHAPLAVLRSKDEDAILEYDDMIDSEMAQKYDRAKRRQKK